MKWLLDKTTRILLGTNGLILVAGAMLGPIYAMFVEEVGGSLLDASYAFAIFATAAGITSILSGRISDKVKENTHIVVIGYGIMGVGFLGFLLVHTIWTLLVMEMVIGFGEAIYAPAFDSIYSKHLARHRFGRGWGMWEAMNYFTTAFGAIAGGVLVTLFGFNTIFVIMGLLCFMGAVYIYRLS